MIDKPLIGEDIYLDPQFTDGLVGCWLMNEGVGLKAHDTSGYERHADFYGSMTWTAGRTGACVKLDGTDDYITLEEVDAATFEFENRFSVSIWIKVDSIDKYDVAIGTVTQYGEGWRLWTRDEASHTWYWEVYDGTEKNTQSTSAVIVNSWQHIVVVHDGAYLRIYINGVQEGTPTAVGNVDYAANSTRTVIGAMTNNSTATSFIRFIEGQVSNAVIFDKVLTEVEILHLYQDPFWGFRKNEAGIYHL